MRKVAIVAGDVLTPLGNLRSTWENMLAGQSGLRRKKLASISHNYPLGLIDGLIGAVGTWERLRSCLDRLLASLPALPQGINLFVATTKAAVDELVVAGGDEHGQPWHLADYIQDKLQVSGRPLTVSGACASGTLGIIQGSMRIAGGECDHALVIGVDLVADFILSGFDSLKALSPDGARPFDRSRNGLSLGDGAGWLLLSSADHMKQVSDDMPLAWLKGWGIACDASHITAPCRNGSGLKLVFDQMTTASPIPLGSINSHGTGTVYNDAMELLVFEEKCSRDLPICSVKGAIGHSLGAAGVVEAMLSVQSLHAMVLPPTIGLEEPVDCGQNISGRQALSLLAPSIISCNSGFGGINAGIYLSR